MLRCIVAITILILASMLAVTASETNPNLGVFVFNKFKLDGPEWRPAPGYDIELRLRNIALRRIVKLCSQLNKTVFIVARVKDNDSAIDVERKCRRLQAAINALQDDNL